MRIAFTLFFLTCLISAKAQLLAWAPQFPSDQSSVTITVDATKGNKGLLSYTGTVYIHFGVITSASTSSADWKYVSTSWGSTTAPTATPAESNKWSFTINNPRAYFGVPAGETILKIVLLFRDASGSRVQRNADGSDMYVPIYPAGARKVQFTQPFIVPTYSLAHEDIKAGLGVSVPVTAVAADNDGILNLYFNGTKISGPVTGNTTITGSAAASVKGSQEFIAEYITGGTSYYDTLNYYITPDITVAALPAGVKEGINYDANCSSATLVLFAPNKNNVVVVGDFPGSDWTPKAQFQMNKTPDGNYYWITLTGLVSGTEYAFNYRVDDSIYVADPYTEKVLDPYNDPYISTATYPNLKPYPYNHNVSVAKNGIMSVLQTCPPPYNWQVTNFTKPDKQNLVAYELLVRDFGDARNYQMLIDTISYFKRLGINAIELMPVNEFSGNDSWGYNPTFYFALDKAYGTKNKFKEFIDLCHKNGIAVILDVVYNHMDASATPQGKLYWENGRPAANSPWFNQTAPHPYSVFEDLNHSSTATQYLVERSLDYWLSEYKIDGYRLDLGKGFTQTVSNGTTVENYDSGRVANLKRYYNSVVTKNPNTYMIIEFLGQQRQEEQEYANHGFLLWGNNNPAYNQATMGYKENSNFSKIIYNSSEQAFSTPAEMGYMESHDEERLMVKNLAFGNSSGGYSVKDLATALERQAAAAALFFTIPGPKLIWQFGERGYDISIDANGGRVSAKPPHWEYMQDPNRLKLFDAYSTLIRLRLQNPSVFNSAAFSYDFNDNNGNFKRFQIADSDPNGMKVTVVANFDVVPQTRTVTFQTTGTWYTFLGNGTGAGLNGATGTIANISSATQTITLQPGEYHVYLDRQVVLPLNLMSFSGRRTTSNISLGWLTSNEVNVKHFVVERSMNGIEFNSIATVTRNSPESRLAYTYVDNDPIAVRSDKKIYYRLKLTDKDGSYSYSSIVVVNSSVAGSNFTLFPNPVTGSQVYVLLDEAVSSLVQLRIEDISGRLIRKYTLPVVNGRSTTPISVNNLSSGTYVLRMQADKKSFVQKLIIKN
ncbi:alpha-amylase family glycosyl hydrolase [Segetibacter sp.]|uniref:alpha-amylase family glycosyl hydrolase n=1 Tax=Segetibacter sp. TaxID=2231182 RepID=UPI00261D88D6|nr:alpha-amylase family glycosyl hydrolase [Segetibacter sp.]MCW3082210.1 type sorting protein [Segetibacter sp.]